MRQKTVVAALAFGIVLIVIWGCGQSVPRDEEMTAVARHVAEGYMNELKGELMTALSDTAAGTAGAIFVCSEKAPEISARYAALPGLTVRRTAKKVRNPNNAPDEYELKTLNMLEERPAFGSQDHSEWEISGNQQTFRFVRAINTSSVCLRCHGDPEKMDPEVKAAIAEKYPEDQATGFKLDDMRGLLTVSIKWPEFKPAYDSISAEL